MSQVVSAGWEGVNGSLESHGIIALNRPPLLLLPWADLVGAHVAAGFLRLSFCSSKSGVGACLSPGLRPGESSLGEKSNYSNTLVYILISS